MAPTTHERLRAAGLRATSARTTVLGVLDEARIRREHLPVAEVADRARSVLGTISTQAVYDCLEALTNAGLARRNTAAASAVWPRSLTRPVSAPRSSKARTVPRWVW